VGSGEHTNHLKRKSGDRSDLIKRYHERYKDYENSFGDCVFVVWAKNIVEDYWLQKSSQTS
jgi:hypothetical protein